jgi:putative acyl-CoA dehydrogenase
LSREGDAAVAVLQTLMSETAGLPGAAEAASFAIKSMLRPDNERVARQAVEVLAMLAAAAALNIVHPAHAELFARTRLDSGRSTMFGGAELNEAQSRSLLQRALPS